MNTNTFFQNRILSQALSIVLIFLLVFTNQLCFAFADEKTESSAGQAVENTYVLSVSTGVSPGDNILFFGVVYKDEDGTKRTKYVMSCENDLAAGYAKAEAIGGFVQERRNEVKSLTGYDVSGEYGVPMEAYSTNQFLFETKGSISELISVKVYTRGGDTWTCQGINLYQVDTLYGVQMAGYYSNNYYVEFDGTLMAKMDGLSRGYITFNWDVDKAITIPAELGGTNGFMNTDIPTEEQNYSSRNSDKYFFNLTFEDSSMAGIESLVNLYASDGNIASIKEMNICEAIALTVVYEDIYGRYRQVTMPYITSALAWAVKNGVDTNEKVMGIAQQGDEVGFEGVLPDCEKINSYSITYGYEEANALAGTIPSSNANHNERSGWIKTNVDSIKISNFAVYDAENIETNTLIGEGVIRTDISGDPLCEYKQKNEIIEPGKGASHALVAYNGSRDTEEDYSNKYLVTLKTDNMESAGTMVDVFVKFNYISLSGEAKETAGYSIREYIEDYYGYWPGNGSNLAYYAGMAPNGLACFVITLNDVDYFTDAEFSMGVGTNDDWQLQSLQISRLTSMEKRGCNWEPITMGKYSTDRTIYRNYEGYPILNMQNTVLIQSGDSKSVKLSGDTEIVENDVDWSKIRYSMNYEESTQNLGFTKARASYNVSVQVVDEAVSSSGTDDCGSRNQFYFQLVFENGRSGYVLANQQLSADGFRSGYTETFSIITNQDYGNIESINIIPDDISSESEVFDKLKIDNIKISLDTDGGLSKQWVADNVGWISIDFKDEGAMTSIRGQEGRTEAEMARNVPINYSSYAMNLLFTIATAEYESGIQMEGSVTGTLCYYNGAGEIKTITFDVVKAMYEYANKPAKYNVTLDENGNISSAGNALSDPSWMFRPNHTDRFVVSVDDIAELVYITVKANSKTVAYWGISGLSVASIDSAGSLSLNSNDEYIKTNEIKEIATHNSTLTPAYTIFCPLNTDEEINIYFTQNKIEIEENENAWTTSITREPTSTNDSLNLFVYTSEGGSSMNEYDVLGSMQYTNVFGTSYQVSTGIMNKVESQNLFYVRGINANNMTTLNKVTLKADSYRSQLAYIDHVIVQQVRSGVIVETYYIDFQDYNIEYEGTASPTPKTEQATEKQTVTLQLGEYTETAALISEDYDLAVALHYSTTSDPAGYSYRSPFVFLTDANYKAIVAGNTFTLDFHEPYVDKITGISVVASGGIAANVDSACVAKYEVGDETGQDVCTGWYGFANGTSVGRNATMLQPTSSEYDSMGTVTPLKITLESGGGESDSGSPIKAVIGYLNYNGSATELEVADLRNHAISGRGFNNEGILNASVMLRGVSQISWISIEPTDTDLESIAGCNIGSISLKMPMGEKSFSANKIIDEQIFEGNPKIINLSNVTVSANARTYSTANGAYTERNTINGTMNILAESGRPILIDVEILGSEKGFTAIAEKTSGDASADANKSISVSGDTVTFSPPSNTSQNNVTYCITISPNEAPGITVKVNVTVEPSPDSTTTTRATEPLSMILNKDGETNDQFD